MDYLAYILGTLLQMDGHYQRALMVFEFEEEGAKCITDAATFT